MFNKLFKGPIEWLHSQPQLGGGGSSGGGGGGSGAVSYPAYMQSQHETWMTDIDTEIASATSNNPFTSATAFDPTDEIAAMSSALAALEVELDAFDPDLLIASTMSAVATALDAQLLSDGAIVLATKAFSDLADNEFDVKTRPKFLAGMRDINAVQSSTFLVGLANLESDRAKSVESYAADLYIKKFFQRNELIGKLSGDFIQLRAAKVQFWLDYTRSRIDAMRIAIVALKEEADQNLSIDENDARWGIDLYQHAANMLGAIGGGTVSTGKKQASQGQSALGGALAGAAMGAQVGGGYGAAIGAGAGLLLGLFN